MKSVILILVHNLYVSFSAKALQNLTVSESRHTQTSNYAFPYIILL